MFWQKNKKQQDSNRKNLFLITTLFTGLTWILGFLKLKRIEKFVKNQKREIQELKSGEESTQRFFKDSKYLLRDLFIPHEGNDHKPKALRPKSLISYVAVIVAVKVLVTGFLFLNYPDPAALSAIVAEKMVFLINQSRIEAGVEPIITNSALIQSALEKGQDMLERGYFAHNTPDGKKPWQWIDKNQFDYVYAGENLAIDFKSAEAVHQALMDSPTHRKNILNTKYKNVGIAVLDGTFDGRKTILLVEFFGTTRNELSTLADNRPVSAPAVNPTPAQPATNNINPTPTQTPTQPIVQQPVPVNPNPALIQPIPTPAVTKPVNPVVTNPNVAGEETEELNPIQIEAQEQRLAAGIPDSGVIVVDSPRGVQKSMVDFVIEYSNIFFIAFLIFLLVSLMLNILVKFQVQHSSVIFQTLAVIALVTAMVIFKFSFAEQISSHILIL